MTKFQLIDETEFNKAQTELLKITGAEYVIPSINKIMRSGLCIVVWDFVDEFCVLYSKIETGKNGEILQVWYAKQSQNCRDCRIICPGFTGEFSVF